MTRKRTVVCGMVVAFVLMVFVSAPVGAQSGLGGIAGVVKDTSGAVLPGVTVEVASPALIEKVRTAITDGEGQFKITDLRPGAYTVTFTLPGFSTFKREGIELPANFTATVNGEMKIGAVEETVTVTGTAPVVDLRSAEEQQNFSRDMLDILPAARKTMSIMNTVPAVKSVSDVGGTSGDYIQPGTVHGSANNDTSYDLDGMGIQGGYTTGGAGIMFYLNNGSIQETTAEVSGMSAESPTGGLRFNVIPKEGGNTFHGTFLGSYSNNHLQSNNVTPTLIAQGLRDPNQLDKIWDINPGLGGPIVKDKLWFVWGFRQWGTYSKVAGIYYNLAPTGNAYTPDFNRQAPWRQRLITTDLRLTWQAAPKHKISLFYGWESSRFPDGLSNGGFVDRSPEAVQNTFFMPNYIVQATWSAPVTNRLLLQAGGSAAISRYFSIPAPGASADAASLTEQNNNFTIRAAPSQLDQRTNNFNYRASATYVSGSHTFKTGLTFMNGWARNATLNPHPGSMNLFMFNGVPSMVTIYADPLTRTERLKANLGLYAQDAWTRKRLTLNLGVRFDFMNAYVPTQHLPAGLFVGARDFAPIDDVPNWKDLSSRLAAVYDLFGDGKTALKVNLGRFVVGQGTGSFTNTANPVNSSVNSANRSWTDLNGDFIPQENELGALSNRGFGGLNILTRYSDEVRQGFNVRPYNWQGSIGLQRELLKGLAVNAAYFRRWYGNQRGTNNLAVSPTDYDQYCITAPADARLGSVSGQQTCGLVNITPLKFGLVNNLIEPVSKYGKVSENFNGVDVTVNARLPYGAQLSGGTSTGKSALDVCDVIGKGISASAYGATDLLTAATLVPSTRFCHQETPFLTSVKLFGAYPLPWGLLVSAMWQNLPGTNITASYVATNAQIAPSLGRSLAGGARNVTVSLIAPGAEYTDRMNQLDARLLRTFRIGHNRVQGMLDFYNLLNSHDIPPSVGAGIGATGLGSINTAYGPDWLKPLRILNARLVKVGVQIDF